MPKLEITSQERSALRAAAHPLRPVVLIGERGLTDAVLKEVETHLNAHGLIKVKVAGDDREARIAMLETLCDTLSCANVHHLGKTLIIFRPNGKSVLPEKETEPATRAVRKAAEPHTPKKQLAEGISRTRKSEREKRAASRNENPENAAPRARRALASAASAKPAHGIPRRTGSALSLRAGARRGLSGRSGGNR